MIIFLTNIGSKMPEKLTQNHYYYLFLYIYVWEAHLKILTLNSKRVPSSRFPFLWFLLTRFVFNICSFLLVIHAYLSCTFFSQNVWSWFSFTGLIYYCVLYNFVEYFCELRSDQKYNFFLAQRSFDYIF